MKKLWELLRWILNCSWKKFLWCLFDFFKRISLRNDLCRFLKFPNHFRFPLQWFPLNNFLFRISNWFGPHPITFLTNAIAKGCGFRCASCWCLLHNKIPSNTFRCMHNAATKVHRSDIVCATGKEKHTKTNPEHVKNWRKKAHHLPLNFPNLFIVHASLRPEDFSRCLDANFFYTRKSSAIDF